MICSRGNVLISQSLNAMFAPVIARCGALVTCLLISMVLTGASIAFAQSPTHRLRQSLEGARLSGRLVIEGEQIQAFESVFQFYEDQGFATIWHVDDRRLPFADSLIALIGRSGDHGLSPSDYHHALFQSIAVHSGAAAAANVNSIHIVDLDILLTDAFFIFGVHLVKGKVNPQTFDTEWFATPRSAELTEVLRRVLAERSLGSNLRQLTPSDPMYAKLQEARRRYLAISARGGWVSIPPGAALRVGDSGERVMALARRLNVTGELATIDSSRISEFTPEIERAVQQFQLRHGLNPDGVAGTRTLDALNVPASRRALQIELNLERWRWLPERLAKRHITVNIAGPELDVVDDGKTVLTMRVIVGKQLRRTPVFSDRITYLVLNPYWNIPPKLAIQDIVPQIRKNPLYLEEQGIRVMSGYGAGMKTIDPAMVDWSKVSGASFPYWLRQDPGPMNALGRFKFMFPNVFNVYLHDTPKRELFAKESRDFSSGCIRVEKPLELAEYVLKSDPRWARDVIVSELENAKDRAIQLPEKIEIHLMYWTAFVDENDVVNFRNDIYGRDSLLQIALDAPPPSPTNSEIR